MREYIEFRDAPAWWLANWDQYASALNTETSPPSVLPTGEGPSQSLSRLAVPCHASG